MLRFFFQASSRGTFDFFLVNNRIVLSDFYFEKERRQDDRGRNTGRERRLRASNRKSRSLDFVGLEPSARYLITSQTKVKVVAGTTGLSSNGPVARWRTVRWSPYTAD